MVPRTSGRRLRVAALLVALLTGFAAQAAPVRGDAFGWFDGFGSWWAALWQGESSPRELPGPAALTDKEGSMMDPHGQPAANPTPPDRTDEGPGIDPDG